MISTMRTLSGDATIPTSPRVVAWAVFSEDTDENPMSVHPEYYDPNNAMHETSEARAEVQKRLDAWANDEWTFTSVRAGALVRVPIAGREVFEFEVLSPGLFGIESDSERSYFDEVGDEQLEELRGILDTLNIDTSLQEDLTTRWGR